MSNPVMMDGDAMIRSLAEEIARLKHELREATDLAEIRRQSNALYVKANYRLITQNSQLSCALEHHEKMRRRSASVAVPGTTEDGR